MKKADSGKIHRYSGEKKIVEKKEHSEIIVKRISILGKIVNKRNKGKNNEKNR